jgi:aspartate carbamoyltransferase catalytic subunit
MESITKRDFISIDDLSNDEIAEIFRLADEMQDVHARRGTLDILNGKIMATLFYEPSTRTRLSFESAMLRLGGRVITAPDMQASSSAAKGETLADTAKVVAEYADVVVIRHPVDGSSRVAASHSAMPVINAGDGSHEHPTQTLCDLYTLIKEKGRIKGLTVALCGDLRFGRTIHSFAAALARFGANLVLIPGQGLDMPDYLLRRLAIKYEQKLERAKGLDFLAEQFKNFDAMYITPNDPEQQALQLNITIDLAKKRFDVFYMTRSQKERLAREFQPRNYPKLDANTLKSPRLKDTIFMHPLPRIDEIPKELDQDPRSKYFKQASYGVLVRMALLRFLLESEPHSSVRVQPQSAGLSIYRNSAGVGPVCPNENCISRHERDVQPEFLILTREKTYSSHLLVLECRYCAFEVSVSIIGNRRTKKFCSFDPALEDFVHHWLAQDALILFNSERESRDFGFSPYLTGPQRQVMNSYEIASAIEKLSKDIAASVPDLGDLCLIGLKNRGDIIAKRIAEVIERGFPIKVPVDSLDVLPFRDDVHAAKEPISSFNFSIENKAVVIVDDVLYSGRTTRAAINAVLSGIQRGRPRDVKAAVLVDRGHRQVPIQPTFVGKHLPSAKTERVEVRLSESSGKDEVVIFKILVEDEPFNPRG